MKIVAIDDSELVLGMLQMICHDIGHDYEGFPSVPDSIDADLVIVDLNLPSIADSVAEVKTRHEGDIVVLSGLSAEELIALDLPVKEAWSKDLGMPGLHAKLSAL